MKARPPRRAFNVRRDAALLHHLKVGVSRSDNKRPQVTVRDESEERAGAERPLCDRYEQERQRSDADEEQRAA
jgi:hypothetical protein